MSQSRSKYTKENCFTIGGEDTGAHFQRTPRLKRDSYISHLFPLDGFFCLKIRGDDILIPYIIFDDMEIAEMARRKVRGC